MASKQLLKAQLRKLKVAPFLFYFHTLDWVVFTGLLLLSDLRSGTLLSLPPTISRMILSGVVRADVVDDQMAGSSSQREISDDLQQP